MAHHNENRKFEDSPLLHSGVQGVTYDRFRKKWIARLPRPALKPYLGGFDTIQEAESVLRKGIHENDSISVGGAVRDRSGYPDTGAAAVSDRL